MIPSTIDSQHLRVFVTLARLLNMSSAARELELTPSGISHCLKALRKPIWGAASLIGPPGSNT